MNKVEKQQQIVEDLRDLIDARQSLDDDLFEKHVTYLQCQDQVKKQEQINKTIAARMFVEFLDNFEATVKRDTK